MEYAAKIKALLIAQSRAMPPQPFSELMGRLMISAQDLLSVVDKAADKQSSSSSSGEREQTVRFKLAGLVVFDRFLLFDDEDDLVPERRMEICNHLMKVFEQDKLSLPVYEVVLKAAAACIGNFAGVASVPEVEFLQAFYFPFCMKLMANPKFESHRYAGALVLQQLTTHCL